MRVPVTPGDATWIMLTRCIYCGVQQNTVLATEMPARFHCELPIPSHLLSGGDNRLCVETSDSHSLAEIIARE